MSDRQPVKRRSQFFGQQIVRLMTKTCVANELGPTAFTLLAVVSAQQDAAGGRPVNFFNEQIMPLVGIRKWDTLDLTRKACVKAGWLQYDPPPAGSRRTPGVYAVLIPQQHSHVTDSRCDEGSPKPYPLNGDAIAKAYPLNGYSDGDGRGYSDGDSDGEPPSSPSPSPSKREAAPLLPDGDAPSSSKKTNERFKPPTLHEVSAYCLERSNGIDAQQFIDHYCANGWKVGRNPMKDWRAAVRTWERNGIERGRASSPAGSSIYAELSPRPRPGLPPTEVHRENGKAHQ